jgi:hypothetical protein
MTAQNRYKGMFALDAMMSIIPLTLIFVFLMQSMSLAAESENERADSQELFDRLVSAADYTVKSGLAKHDGDARYPNWLGEKIDPDYVESIREKGGFSSLEISYSEPDNGHMCVYRLVVTGPSKKISKIYFCGD